MSRSALCLLLLCAGASATVAARDVRQLGPNSGGGQCPEIANAVAEATEKAPAKKPVTTTPQRKPAKTNPTARGDGDSGARIPAPRWHSFLPGMFR